MSMKTIVLAVKAAAQQIASGPEPSPAMTSPSTYYEKVLWRILASKKDSNGKYPSYLPSLMGEVETAIYDFLRDGSTSGFRTQFANWCIWKYFDFKNSSGLVDLVEVDYPYYLY